MTSRSSFDLPPVVAPTAQPLALAELDRTMTDAVEAWLDVVGIRGDGQSPLFRVPTAARGLGRGGFRRQALGRRAVQRLVERYVRQLRLDLAVTFTRCRSPP
jgi:hypothetical protein